MANVRLDFWSGVFHPECMVTKGSGTTGKENTKWLEQQKAAKPQQRQT